MSGKENRKQLWSGLLMLLPLLLTAAPASGRPMTFADHLAIKRISALALAPDEALLALLVESRSLEENKGSVQLQFVRPAGTGAVPAPVAGVREPVFSPDSKTLAYVKSNEGKDELWLLPLAGDVPLAGDGGAEAQAAPEAAATEEGKARLLLGFSTGISGLRWSPDGAAIYFNSDVFPFCADDAANQAELARREASPVKARAWDTLMFRHWDSWNEGRVTHLFRVELKDKAVRDLMPGDPVGTTGEFDLSPDGKMLAVVRDVARNQPWKLNHELVLLASDGSPAKLPAVPENPALDKSPRFSPDGKYLAYLRTGRPGYESDRFRFAVLELATGRLLFPAAGLDAGIDAFGWNQDSGGLWCLVQDRGRSALYQTKLEGELKKLKDGVWMSLPLRGKDTFYYVGESLTAGPELRALTGGRERLLTALNRELFEGVELARVEDYWWEDRHGEKLHGFLLFPPGTSKDKANPLLVLIHGGPQGMWADQLHPRWNAQLLAAPGFVTFLPNPSGSTGYGTGLTERVSRDWGGRAYEEIMAGVNSLIEKGWVDPGRMCAAGGSYGGYMTNWLEAKTRVFRCLITHAGVFDLRSKYGATEELWFPEWEFGGPPWEGAEDYTKFSPSNYVKDFATPMLVIHGANDFRVPVEQAFQMFTTLQRRGIPSRLLLFPDETHFISKPKNSELWYREVHDWLSRWLLN